MSLYEDWLAAKETEQSATEKRRAIEDLMAQELGINEAEEGTKTLKRDGYQVRVISRINRKVDGDLAQEIAAEHGLTEHLGRLFRWKPELNMKAWQDASDSITAPLAAAITAKPGRPSFSISKIEEK